MNRFNCVLIAVVLSLSACSDGSDNSSSVKQSNKTVIDSQLHALEKAKGVEKKLIDAADQRKMLIDAQENH